MADDSLLYGLWVIDEAKTKEAYREVEPNLTAKEIDADICIRAESRTKILSTPIRVRPEESIPVKPAGSIH